MSHSWKTMMISLFTAALAAGMAAGQQLPVAKATPPQSATGQSGPIPQDASDYERLTAECRRLIRVSDLANAQHVCVWQARAAEKLPVSQVRERVRANENAGEAFFKEGRAKDALPYNEKAVRLAKVLGSDDPENAYAAYYLARVENRLQQFDEAARMYGEAERGFDAARNPGDQDDDDSRYLKTALTEHAEMLRREHQEQQAAELEKRAASIDVRSPVKADR